MSMRAPFKQIGALYVPSHLEPDQIGLGCPKCDDSELIPFSAALSGPASHPAMQRFLKRHARCGNLEQLEIYAGKLGITGTLDPQGSS
jgi:hypothetical protein